MPKETGPRTYGSRIFVFTAYRQLRRNTMSASGNNRLLAEAAGQQRKSQATNGSHRPEMAL